LHTFSASDHEPDRPRPPLPVDLASHGAARGRRRSGRHGHRLRLDAITTIQPESPAEAAAARERALPASRMQYRLHRRSTF